MIIVDLVKTDIHDSIWKECLRFINDHCTSDPLYKNYIDLKKTDFISLPVVIVDNKIIAFSGAQVKEEWGPNIARVSSRFWLHPSIRHNISKFETSETPWYNSEYLIGLQLETVANLGIPHVFISREGKFKKGFQKFIDLVNKFNASNFCILDQHYDISGIPQLIAIHSSLGVNYQTYLREETFLKPVDVLEVTNG